MPTTWYVETTGNDSTGSGTSGAPYLTVGKAVSVAAGGDTIAVQTGTYTITSAITLTQSNLLIQGFGVTAGDNGTPPLITTATNSIANINTASANAGVLTFQNLHLSSTAGTRGSGIWQFSAHGSTQWWVFIGCLFDGFGTAVDSSNGTPDDVGYIGLVGCEVKNTTTGYGVSMSSGGKVLVIDGCYFHGNINDVSTAAEASFLRRSIFAGASGTGAIFMTLNYAIGVDSCVIYNAAGYGLGIGSVSQSLTVANSIFYGNNQAINLPSSSSVFTGAAAASRNNAYGNNTNPSTNWPGSPGDIALSADPFVSGSGGNFALNSTAGGGTACKQAGYPGVFGGGLTTGYPDVGAAQGSSGGGGGVTGILVAPGMGGGIRG